MLALNIQTTRMVLGPNKYNQKIVSNARKRVLLQADEGSQRSF